MDPVRSVRVDDQLEVGPGSTNVIGAGHRDVIGPGCIGEAPAAIKFGRVDSNRVHEILVVGRTIEYIRIMTEPRRDGLGVMIWSLRSRPGLGSDDERMRSPACKATSIGELRCEEMEQLGIITILENTAAPRSVAIRAKVARIHGQSLVVSETSRRRSEIQPAAVIPHPARIASTLFARTFASLAERGADAIEATVLIGLAGRKRDRPKSGCEYTE